VSSIQPRNHYLREAAEFLRLAAAARQRYVDNDDDRAEYEDARLSCQLASANIAMARELRGQS
jgi:hypothetical protein